MKSLELKVPPAILVVIVAAGMWVLSGLSPNLSFRIPAGAWLASALAVVGVCIAILGVAAFRAADTTVDPRVPDQSANLVVEGIYRYTRNPMYLGFLLVLSGWGVYLGNVVALLLLPAFVLYLNRFQIVPEERVMAEKFGEAYRRYRSDVRRWL